MSDDATDGGGLDIDPEDPELLRNPQAMFAFLREHMPVLQTERNQVQTTMVSRHEDVMAVLRTPEVFSSREDAVHIGNTRPLIPLQIDPPNHAKYRKLLDPLFAPRRIAELEPATRALVAELIDGIVDDGECNFHEAVAEPLPSTVFLQLLGLPLERAKEFIALKDGIIRPDAVDVDDRLEKVNATGQQIYAVLEEVVDARAEERQDDFISGFLDAEVDGHALTRDEIVDICYLFFLAGLDTVTASLDCIVAYLAQHPEQRQRLNDDPSLIPAAIEELLRWESPVGGVARFAVADTELSGCPVKAGSMVAVSIGSANTDDAFWDEADSIDFDRATNKHIAFGGGVHRCLGSHLARMELRVTMEEWQKRVPDYEIKPGVELLYSASLRSVDNLELVW